MEDNNPERNSIIAIKLPSKQTSTSFTNLSEWSPLDIVGFNKSGFEDLKQVLWLYKPK